MRKPFKILCIDGGGIKGLYSAKVLSVFEETYGENCSDHFDLICGTSTGGIIALAISLKIPMKDVVLFYSQYGPLIFSQKHKRWAINKFLSLKQALLSSKYSQKQLKKALNEKFSDKRIKDSNNLLCIPAFNMINGSPRIFKKDYDTFNQDDNKTYVEVALATTAAPTYFPVVEIDKIQYADGGLYANNPMLIGLSEVLYKWLKPQNVRDENDYDGVQILSINSLENTCGEAYGRKSRSFLNWRETLFDSYTIGQNKSTLFFLDKLVDHLDFELKITRIENSPLSPPQDKIIKMDNASEESLKLLEAIGLQTGIIYKDKEDVRYFFTTNKTVDVHNIDVKSKKETP